ncbi:MAG TPA: DUF2752 domain-containing protein [Terriglobia bacterium]|jgi:hypothetical protein|nr:DUF2752 domain-containing protein [Terriglobia bacterium]
MPAFAKGIPRLAVLVGAVLGFCLIPPQLLDRGPNICLWRHLFHLAACPSCGSTRALAAFFHGQLQQALAYNRNVAITAPAFLCLLASDISGFARTILRRSAGRLIPAGNRLATSVRIDPSD